MKKNFKILPSLQLLLFIVLIISNSCKKEPLPTVLFTFSPESGFVNDIITFTNTSLDAISYSWDFGDGSSSTDQNPTHGYTAAGTFTITLTATGDGGTSTATKTIEITVPFNIVPGVRIGNFKLSDNYQTLKSFTTGTGSHIVAGFGGGEYWHLISYDETGIAFAFSNNSSSLSNSAMPEQIYSYPPFEGRTEKGITYNNLLTDVAIAYGAPEVITTSGHYEYPSLGINFFADDTKTKVFEITITVPGKKSETPFSTLEEIAMGKFIY